MAEGMLYKQGDHVRFAVEQCKEIFERMLTAGFPATPLVVCYKDTAHQAFGACRPTAEIGDAKIAAFKELLLLIPGSHADEVVCCLDGWATYTTKAESFPVFTVVVMRRAEPGSPEIRSFPYLYDPADRSLFWVDMGDDFHPTKSIADAAAKLLRAMMSFDDDKLDIDGVAAMLRSRGHNVKT